MMASRFLAKQALQAERRLIRELQSDLVFMDIAMPGMNEIEVLEESTKQSPEVRTIILDAGQGREGASQALSRSSGGLSI